MRKTFGAVLSCAAACMLFAGCSLPGMSEPIDDDDFIPDSYYNNSSQTDSQQNYKWIIEPSISADNILVFDCSQIDPDKESNRAYINASVIYQNGLYGFIDYAGNIIVSPSYTNCYTCWCGEMVLYNVTDPANDVREYCSIDSNGQVLYSVSQHENKAPRYFWNSSDESVYQLNADWDYAQKYTEKKTVVVTKAQIDDIGSGYYQVTDIDDSSCALAKENELITDFDYTDYYAPAYKGAGLTAIALQKNGKWGYVSSSGDEIIPFNCDSILSADNGELIDAQEKDHPYLFSEDLVPVSINSTYGYYNMQGECVVAPGEFEQARPVHNGRAWVRKNGKWGVIQLGEIVEEESSVTETTTTTTTTPYYTWTETETTTTTPAETEESTSASTKPPETVTSSAAETTTQPPADTTVSSEEPVVTTEDTVPSETEPQVTDVVTEPELPPETEATSAE